MADSRKEKNVSLGDVNVSTAAAIEDNLNVSVQEVTGVINIAAGKFRVTIQNLGQVLDGDLEVDATILGSNLTVLGPPLIFTAFKDDTQNKLFTTPAITGNANGARVRIIIEEE